MCFQFTTGLKPPISWLCCWKTLPSQGIHLWGSLFWDIRRGRHFPHPHAVVPPGHDCGHMVMMMAKSFPILMKRWFLVIFCCRPQHHIGSPSTSGGRWIWTRCREACRTPLAAIIIMTMMMMNHWWWQWWWWRWRWWQWWWWRWRWRLWWRWW